MRVLGIVSYKGTNYQGWQKQIDAPTIQGTIESVLSQILNSEITIQGSGRTDAGVHAQRQYFHFDLPKEFDLDRLRYSANCLLPKDIFINELKAVNDDFFGDWKMTFIAGRPNIRIIEGKSLMILVPLTPGSEIINS